jgi:hypothetical protein
MTFRSRLTPSVAGSARGFVLMALGAAVLNLGGCADKHIGRPCVLGTSTPDAGSSGGTSTLSSPALECPSRICALPADTAGGAEPGGALGGGGINKGGTGPLCTYGCSSDDDCSDAEIGDKNNSADQRCKSKFVCTWATTVGPFCCQKMCLCDDFLVEPSGGFVEPASCIPGNPTTCANVK